MSKEDAVTTEHVIGGLAGNKKTIPLSSVIYFKADTKYVFAYHEQGELILDLTLKQIEAALGGLVCRVNRETLAMVDRLSKECASLADTHIRVALFGSSDRLIISRRRRREVRDVLQAKAQEREVSGGAQ